MPTDLKTTGLNKSIFRCKHAIIILIILHAAFGLTCLKTVPRIYMDDVWDSALGYNLACNGTLKHPFIVGFGGMDIHFLQPRVVLPFVCAAIFKITGYSILAGRMGSLLMSILALVSLYAVMKHWFSEKQAFFITLAVVLHPWFFEISRRIRPEIYYPALAMVALWLMICSLDSNSPWKSFLAGIFAGLAALSHPIGLILDIAILGAVFIWSRPKKTWRLALWACLGFVVMITPYILYILRSVRDPQVSFFEQMQSGMPRSYLTQISKEQSQTILTIFTGEIRRWKNFLQWPAGIPLIFIMAVSWLLAWYRSITADKIIATVIVLFCLILPFVSTNRAGRYLTILIPFFCALIVRMIWRCTVECRVIPPLKKKLCFAFGISSAVIYVLMCVAAVSLMFYKLREADFTRVVERIASVADREDRVFGTIVLWIGHDRYYYGPFPIDASMTPFRQTPDMIRKYDFDYAVRSAWTFNSSYGVASPPARMPDFRLWHPVDAVCEQYGTKVDEFYDPDFGPFEIYKLNWNDNSAPESQTTSNTFN